MTKRASAEQVRIPVDIMADVRAICGAFDEQATEYVARTLREALKRDIPLASKKLAERAARHAKDEGKGKGGN